VCRERPCSYAADERDELAPFHCPVPPVLRTKDSTALLRCGISIWLMSAGGQIQSFGRCPLNVRFGPLCRLKSASLEVREVPEAALTNRGTAHVSDPLDGGNEQLFRHGDADNPRSRVVYYQWDLVRLQPRQFSRLRALEDTARVAPELMIGIGEPRPVTYQPAD